MMTTPITATFTYRDHKKTYSAMPEEVTSLRADSKYIVVKTKHDEFLIESSLVKLEKKYPGVFVRVSRGLLLNKSIITGIYRAPKLGVWCTTKAHGYPVKISRKMAPVVSAELGMPL